MVRDRPLDVPSTATVMDAATTALGREIRDATPIEEGLNAVFRVTLADDTRLVLKMATLATNEEFRVEPAVLDRLDRETEAPVPSVESVSPDDDNPLDAAHYLMEYCEGRTVANILDLSPDTLERLVAETGNHLASIHELDGWGGFGSLVVEESDLTVADPRPWSAVFAKQVDDILGRVTGEGFVADDEARFADLEPSMRAVFDGFEGGGDLRPTLLHEDVRSANLVLAPDDDAAALVRAVIDPGSLVGDGLLDLALAEVAFVDVPLGGTDRADGLRASLRNGYCGEHDVSDEAFAARYPYYRLYAWAKVLGGFDFFAQYAREDDVDAVAARWRARVEAAVDALA